MDMNLKMRRLNLDGRETLVVVERSIVPANICDCRQQFMAEIQDDIPKATTTNLDPFRA